MRILFLVLAGLAWLSYVRAKKRGVPWFSLQTSRRIGKQQYLWEQHAREIDRQLAAERAALEKKRANRPANFWELNALTRDEAASERLIQHISQMNPGQTAHWCVEKAIYDIHRDRMA